MTAPNGPEPIDWEAADAMVTPEVLDTLAAADAVDDALPDDPGLPPAPPAGSAGADGPLSRWP